MTKLTWMNKLRELEKLKLSPAEVLKRFKEYGRDEEKRLKLYFEQYNRRKK